jgi:hypothetical protein
MPRRNDETGAPVARCRPANSVLWILVEDFDAATSGLPPADPDEWTNEQWIAWLNETDANTLADRNRPPVTVAGRVVHSGAGQVLGQTMMGLARAIYGPRENKPPIIAQANSDPEKDRPFSLNLDFDHPSDSTVVLHPDPQQPS